MDKYYAQKVSLTKNKINGSCNHNDVGKPFSNYFWNASTKVEEIGKKSEWDLEIPTLNACIINGMYFRVSDKLSHFNLVQ